MSRKNKRIGFTVSENTYETWKFITKDLVQRRIFRNQTDIFEHLVYFLQRASSEKIKEFKETSTI